jgi:hypothetical protein
VYSVTSRCTHNLNLNVLNFYHWLQIQKDVRCKRLSPHKRPFPVLFVFRFY